MTAQTTERTAPDPFAGPEWGSAGSGRVRVRVRRKKRRTRRRVLIGAGVLLFLVLVAGCWLAWNAVHARSQLQQVRADVQQLQTEVSTGNIAAARATSATLQLHAAAAQSYVDSPIWSVGEHTPLLGSNLTAAGSLTTIVDHIAQGALPHLVDAANVLQPSRLREADGSIDLAAISHVAPGLSSAHATLASAITSLQRMSASGWASVDNARAQLLAQVTSLGKTVDAAREAARIAPPLLGSTAPRSYMITFQNDAEMRTTGGMPGAFAIVRVSHGRFRFTHFESDGYLVGTRATGVDFGRGYDQLYGTRGNGASAEYRNTNLSPNYPYAAQLWLAMWRHKTGQQLDGAITLDPTALSYLLAASGPATLPDGTSVSSSNVVAYTQSTIYRRFATNNAARKQSLLEIAKAASQQIVAPGVNLPALMHGAAQATSQGRLLLWVSDPAIEARLARLPLGGVEPQTRDPYFRLALWNSTGSKLDYYIHASLDWTSTDCGSQRHVTVTVQLTDTAPDHLPGYVLGLSADKQFHIAPGDEYLGILAYGTQGARLSSYTVDGRSTEPAQFAELGHPVWSDGQFVHRGRTLTLVYGLVEPASSGAPVVPAQPMVNPMQVSVHTSHC